VAAPDDDPEGQGPAATEEMTGAAAEQVRAAKRDAETQPVPIPRTPPRQAPAPIPPTPSTYIPPHPTPTPGSPVSSEPTEVLVGESEPDPMSIPRPLMFKLWVDTDLPLVDRANYEYLGEHARGGLGRIMRAKDVRTGRLVAIKEMIEPNAQARKRFTREALITAGLQHPSIVPVYELGRWSTGEPFFAMKLVSGRSLAEVLRGATLDERLANVPVIMSVAEALAYAHKRRIVHRDLKPANILVGDYGETVVIDWGLAKSVDEIDSSGEIEQMLRPRGIDPTVAGVVLGTPAYMSPEQARGEPIDERSDVYSIGALLYHLIAGHRPYIETGAKTSRAIVDLVSTVAPAALATREAGAPPDLITIANKAMARERDARYADGGEMAEDLRRFLTGQLVAAHHYGRWTLLQRWLRRHRAPVIVGLVLATLLVIVGAIGLRGILVERDRVRTQRDIAVAETARAERQLAAALYEKGRVAETANEWAKASMYYAASRTHHETVEAAWAAGLADARAVMPLVRYEGHAGAWVHAVAITPDGSTVATVDDTGMVRLWSPRDGRTLAETKAAQTALYAVAFSPDGSEIAIAGDDGAIQRRSLDLAMRATVPVHSGRIWALAYSPDGSLIASGGEDTKVKITPVAGGASRELTGHIQRVYSVAFSADGKRIVSGSDDRHVWIWDVASGKGESRGNHVAGGIRVAMFAGNDVVTTGWDHEIRKWPADGSAPSVWSDTHIVHGAAIDPKGELVVTGGEAEIIRVWDLSTHQIVTALDNPGGQTSAVAFSRDGRVLVTAGKTAPIAWDARPLSRLHSVGHATDVVELEVNAEGSTFVSGSTDRTLRVWDLASARELRRITTRAYCGDGVTWLPGDELVAACDDKVMRRWDRAGVERTLALPAWLRFVSLSPDKSTLALGHVDGKLATVDVASWTVASEKTGHVHHIYDVTYAKDGRFVSASLDDHIKVWRGRDFTLDLDLVAEGKDGVIGAALSPDGSQLAAGGQDGTLRVWDVKRSAWLVHREDIAAGTVWKIMYTPDGGRGITAHDDGKVRVWNPATWTDPVVLDAGEGTALAIGVTPDSKTLLAGYKSGAIVIWNLATGQLRSRIGGHVRERGSCGEFAMQTWVDEEHASTVRHACVTPPADYFNDLAKRSHQQIDESVDVRWDWLAKTPPR